MGALPNALVGLLYYKDRAVVHPPCKWPQEMPFAWTVALALRTSSWRRVVRTAAAGGGDDDERRAVLSNLGTHRLFGWLGKSLGGGTEDGRESRRRARALARASGDAPGRGGVARVRGAESGAQIRSGRAPARHPAR